MSNAEGTDSDAAVACSPTPAVPDKPKVLSFSTKRKSEAIEISDDFGVAQVYQCREMTGKERDDWMNEMQGKLRLNDKTGTVLGVTSHEGLQAALISRCLFDPNGKPVPRSAFAQWPCEMLAELEKLCKRINGLDKDQEGKNPNS